MLGGELVVQVADPVLANATWEPVSEPGGLPGLARIPRLPENATP